MFEQKTLLSFPPPPVGTVYVNDRVSFRSEATERVISVHGVVFAHYGIGDRAAEAYTMITLWESEYATQIEIARSFGYSARSLRRYQERVHAGGISALVRHGKFVLNGHLTGLSFESSASSRRQGGC